MCVYVLKFLPIIKGILFMLTAEEIDFGNQEYIELTDESDLSFLGVDSDFEHLLSGDIPTFF